MKYVAIDIETTGLDPERHQILEIGAVVETDWRKPVDDLPTFRALIRPKSEAGDVSGSPAALAMNAALLRELSDPEAGISHGQAIHSLVQFLREQFGDETFTIAGKNFAAFDLKFLSRPLASWSHPWASIKHRHRFIDVGPLFWVPTFDTALPDLQTCQVRAGLEPRTAHSAVEDCRAVIECVRAWHRKGGAA